MTKYKDTRFTESGQKIINQEVEKDLAAKNDTEQQELIGLVSSYLII